MTAEPTNAIAKRLQCLNDHPCQLDLINCNRGSKGPGIAANQQSSSPLSNLRYLKWLCPLYLSVPAARRFVYRTRSYEGRRQLDMRLP